MIRSKILFALSLTVLAACAQKKADEVQPRQWHVTVPQMKSEALTADEKANVVKFINAQESVKMFNPMDYMFSHGQGQQGLTEMQKTLILAVQNNKAACDSNEAMTKTGDIRHPGELVTVDAKRYIQDANGAKCVVNASSHSVITMKSARGENNQVLLNGAIDMPTNSIAATDATTAAVIGAGTTGRQSDIVALVLTPSGNSANLTGTLIGTSSGSVIPVGASFYAYTSASTLWLSMTGQANGGAMEVAVALDIDNAQPKHTVITVRLAAVIGQNDKLTIQEKEVTLNGEVLSGDQEKLVMESQLVGRAVLAQKDRLLEVLNALVPGLTAKPTFSFLAR